MNEKMSATEMYQMQREPLKISEKMKKDAKLLEEEESLRSGEETEQKKHNTKWQKELNEKLLREDHNNSDNKNFSIK